jgi:type IV pilus assembly protein PilV|nr:type IV pilus modification protein PilV [uncultured Pseudoxanthomonas sp.]
MKRILPPVSPGSQRGVGLIEVMVAVLVLAIGVLGIAALQALTLKNTMGSASRTQASIQVYSMMDIIRSDRANLGGYNTNIYTEGDGSGAPGTLMGWLDGLKTTVAPDARGRVVCDADTMTCSVGVQWTDANTTGDDSTPVNINITSQL